MLWMGSPSVFSKSLLLVHRNTVKITNTDLISTVLIVCWSRILSLSNIGFVCSCLIFLRYFSLFPILMARTSRITGKTAKIAGTRVRFLGFFYYEVFMFSKRLLFLRSLIKRCLTDVYLDPCLSTLLSLPALISEKITKTFFRVIA